jgi:hypothetical protein
MSQTRRTRDPLKGPAQPCIWGLHGQLFGNQIGFFRKRGVLFIFDQSKRERWSNKRTNSKCTSRRWWTRATCSLTPTGSGWVPSNDFIKFNCASPMYGLFIDKCLRKGKSDECYTFNNHKLSKDSNFTICKIEVNLMRFGDFKNQKRKRNRGLLWKTSISETLNNLFTHCLQIFQNYTQG